MGRKKHSSSKPPTSLQLARRKKRLEGLIRQLESLASDPNFLASEDAKIVRRAEIDQELDELREAWRRMTDEKNKTVSEQIAAIYKREASNFRDRRSLWQRVTDPVQVFRYTLYPYLSTKRSVTFSPTGDKYGTSFGYFRQSESTWRTVSGLENEADVFRRQVDHDFRQKIETLEREKTELKPFKHNHKSVSDLASLKQQLSECEQQLADAELDEKKLRGHYGVDDRTIAQAAAYANETRQLADKIKPLLRNQLSKSTRCPYCGEDLGEMPHADHVFPVSQGGLSTAENMVYVCSDCNLRKQDMTMREFTSKYALDRDEIEANLILLGKRV